MSSFRACIASIFRTYYSFEITRGPDITFNIIVMGMAALVELSIGVIVACLPVLPKFFQHWGPKISKSFTSQSWIGFTNPENKLKLLRKRTSADEEQNPWSQITGSTLRNKSASSEQPTNSGNVVMFIPEADSLQKAMLSKSLPPTPLASAEIQRDSRSSNEIA